MSGSVQLSVFFGRNQEFLAHESRFNTTSLLLRSGEEQEEERTACTA